MHTERIMESRKELEQLGCREKEPALDNVMFKNLVVFFTMSTLGPSSSTVLYKGYDCIPPL